MTTIVQADLLIDGSGQPPVERPAVAVANGRITGIFPGGAPDELLRSASQILDLPGSTLLPGLIDCHVHLNFPANGSSWEQIRNESDSVHTTTAVFAAQKALYAGVTTVRDTGSKAGTVFGLRRALELGLGQGPRLVLCGPPITMTGGHAWPLGGEADGEDGLRRKVREVVKLGADWIKVMATGGGTANTRSWLPSFRQSELAAIVDEAHRLARKVTVHCLSGAGIAAAIEAGADQIEHASFIIDSDGHQEYDPVIAAKMADSGVVVTATLAVRAYAIKGTAAHANDSEQQLAAHERWKMMSKTQIDYFGDLYAAGVTFVAGTDAGWLHTPFDAVPEEIALMHSAGMPAMEAIVAATSRAATVLGIGKDVGMVKEGYIADLIAVSGNPLTDLSVLRQISMVMQQGEVVPLPGDEVPS